MKFAFTNKKGILFSFIVRIASKIIISVVLFFIVLSEVFSQVEKSTVSVMVTDEKGDMVEFATVYLKGTTFGTSLNNKGVYTFKAPIGKYILVVSAVGYGTQERDCVVKKGGKTRFEISMTASSVELDEVEVVSGGVGRLKKSAFNAVALDARNLYNSSKNISDAINMLPGMKMRESGGVGSDTQLMLDGFSGKHVKVFIDGVPQEGGGTSFDISNIPINYAESIEVYKGVVPVAFGTDAIGGVINIVTNKNRRKWYLDASYSYGSFNTHKSYVNFGQNFKNGFTYEINAFQNFSDNSYYIDNWVRTFTVNENGTITKHPVNQNDIKHVKRFNDQFHNEAVIGKVGVKDKNWADKMLFGLNYSRFYKEQQTGVYQEIVFGEKHKHGYILSPSFEYKKRNALTNGLDITLSLNYNHNITYNVDTASRYYNWYGDFYKKDSSGEQSYQNSEQKNTNWHATANISYRFHEAHNITINSVFSHFMRTSRSYIGTSSNSSSMTEYSIPKITLKNISGLSYRFMPSWRWNVSAFTKYYIQNNKGPVSLNSDGVGNYLQMSKETNSVGYGFAGTYNILKNLQTKLSYEKAYRLPTTEELFGDEDLEAGKTSLLPESSHNININLNYSYRFFKHNSIYVDGGIIYRDTKNYIKRGIGKHGSTQFGIYENHGHVKTKGYNLTLRYSYDNIFTLGGTLNNIDTRDYEEMYTGSSKQKNIHYKDRLPNIPYLYANIDAGVNILDFIKKGNTLSMSYDCFYQHEFPLYWESIGDKDSKNYVPSQLSHNVSVSYSFDRGRYNMSLECSNITDAKLYDNFSLQKAGRAFYAKFRINIGNK